MTRSLRRSEKYLLDIAEDSDLRVEFAHCRQEFEDPEVFQNVRTGCLTNALDSGQILPYRHVAGMPVLLNAMFGTNAITKCSLTLDGEPVASGYSFCTENFCKVKGRVIALKRALELFSKGAE